MTLLEVMVAAAIMSIALLVTTAIFVTLTGQKREAERLIEVEGVGLGALSQLQIDLGNAGYRFPAPAFGVHVFNNVTALTPGNGLGANIDTTTGCGSGGLAVGSDAIEVAMGLPQYAPGKVQFVDSFPPNSPTTDHNIVLVTPTPFTTFDVSNSGVALFYDTSGESCIGFVTSGPGVSAPPNMNVTMLTREYDTVPNAATYYPNCPRAGMSVYRLAQRKRFFLCSEFNDGGVVNPTTSLYRLATLDGGYILDGVAEKLQDGVEDFQITARMYAGLPSPLTGADTDCSPAMGFGRPYCLCNQTSSSACDLTPTLTSLNATLPAALISSVQLSLTSLGTRPMKDTGNVDAGRPASRDNPAGILPDGFRRLQTNTTIGMNNLTQVRP